MPNPEYAEKLKKEIEGLFELFEKDLVSRSEWGSINFKKAEPKYAEVKEILSRLKSLPMEKIPGQGYNEIIGPLSGFAPILKQVDEFKIEEDNPVQRNEQLLNNISAHCDAIYVASAKWIPFLESMKGDVGENEEELISLLKNARALSEEARLEFEKSKKAIENMAIGAREATASTGATVFTADFENESGEQVKQSMRWFAAALIVFLLTIEWASFLYFSTVDTPNILSGNFFQMFVGKLVILSMLIWGTVWCAGQYKTLKHLSTLNKHRALSIKTLQAFSSAASDPQVKDVVLIEACKAVFSAGQTGYLGSDENSPSPSMQILEIAKRFKGNE